MIYKKEIFNIVGSSYQPKENREELFRQLTIYMETDKKIKEINKYKKHIYDLMIMSNIYKVFMTLGYDSYNDYGNEMVVENISFFNTNNVKVYNVKLYDYIKDMNLYNLGFYSSNGQKFNFNIENIDEFFINTIPKKDLEIYYEIENYEKDLLDKSIQVNNKNNDKISKKI